MEFGNDRAAFSKGKILGGTFRAKSGSDGKLRTAVTAKQLALELESGDSLRAAIRDLNRTIAELVGNDEVSPEIMARASTEVQRLARLVGEECDVFGLAAALVEVPTSSVEVAAKCTWSVPSNSLPGV